MAKILDMDKLDTNAGKKTLKRQITPPLGSFCEKKNKKNCDFLMQNTPYEFEVEGKTVLAKFSGNQSLENLIAVLLKRQLQ